MRLIKILLVFALISTLLIVSAVSLASKSKAQQYYDQAEKYATEGRWDLAADNYALAAKEYAKFKGIQEKLDNARIEACAMLIRMGDDAKAKDNLDQALALYNRALYYQPASAKAKSRIDQISKDMVAVYYNRGRNYENQRLWQDALNEYEKAYAINPNYQDLDERYRMVKAQIKGSVPFCAILFFINHSEQSGLDMALIQALNDEITSKYAAKVSLVDQRKVQAVMTEQASALGDDLNNKLALDIGRLLGVQQIIIGEIATEGKKSNKLKISAQLLKVPEGDVLQTEKVSESFSNAEELKKDIPKIAKSLAKKLM